MSVRVGSIAVAAVGLMVTGNPAVTSGAAGTSATQASVARFVLPARCSRTAASRVRAGSWTPAQEELAPPGAGAIRLCRYSGLNARPRLRLTRSVLRSDPSLIAELVREFDRLPSAQGTIACPADDGSEIVAQLAYPDGHAVTIRVGMTGCEIVSNGRVYRIAAGFGSPPAFGPQLVAQLKRLTAWPVRSNHSGYAASTSCSAYSPGSPAASDLPGHGLRVIGDSLERCRHLAGVVEFEDREPRPWVGVLGLADRAAVDEQHAGVFMNPRLVGVPERENIAVRAPGYPLERPRGLVLEQVLVDLPRRAVNEPYIPGAEPEPQVEGQRAHEGLRRAGRCAPASMRRTADPTPGRAG